MSLVVRTTGSSPVQRQDCYVFPSLGKIIKTVGLLFLMLFNPSNFAAAATPKLQSRYIVPNPNNRLLISTPLSFSSLQPICLKQRPFDDTFSYPISFSDEGQKAVRSIKDYYHLKLPCLEITRSNAFYLLSALEDFDLSDLTKNLEKAKKEGFCLISFEKLKELCRDILHEKTEKIHIQTIRLLPLGPCQENGFHFTVNDPFSRAPSQIDLPQMDFSSYVKKSRIIQGNPITIVPEYLISYYQNGFYTAKNGRIGYKIREQKVLKNPDQKLDVLERTITSQLDRITLNTIYAKKNSDTKGYGVEVREKMPEKITLALNPQKVLNQKAAMDFLVAHVVKPKKLFQIGEYQDKDFIARLLETHQILFQNVKDLNFKPGHLRQHAIIVFDENIISEKDLPSLRKRLAIVGTRADLEAFDASIKNKIDGDEAVSKMTQRQKEAWSKLGYITPNHTLIRSCLKKFVKELKNNYASMQRAGEVDWIALATFAFRKIIDIHPFSDGNGRLARAYMNAILMRGGIAPPVFLDDEEYTLALEKDRRNPGHFATYLVEKINQANALFAT
jgi:hypothetical protein